MPFDKTTRSLCAGALILAVQPSVLAWGAKRITDLRFNADYAQITNSVGDEWAPTWADDGNLYTGNDDGSSFGGIGQRTVAFGKLAGDDLSKLRGFTVSDMGGYGKDAMGPDNANWKTMNTYCVDGILYMFVTRCQYPEQAGDAHHRHVFKNSCIIKSTDKGKTWWRPAEESLNHPMFPGLKFGAPYFVWYGKDGEASVDNARYYVYAVANNGHFEDGDYFILGRVSRKKLPDLNAADWEFYTGGNGMAARNWASDINLAKPILQDPLNCSMTGMTYIPGLGRYVMVVWHYTTYNLRTDPRTINDYYEAPKPWGPWGRFKTIDTGNMGWYVPIVGQKFQRKVDAHTVECVLFPTGNYQNSALYKLNFIPITLSTKPLPPAAGRGSVRCFCVADQQQAILLTATSKLAETDGNRTPLNLNQASPGTSSLWLRSINAHYRLMPKQRHPLLGLSTVLFRTASQFTSAVQVSDQLRLTPRCNQLAFVSEWRIEFSFHVPSLNRGV
ncbi:MAG: hypothetical protein ACLQU3_08150 [Limisphaerales bacterium]